MSGNPQPSGNIANLLNDVTSASSDATNTFSDLAGALADSGGVIGIVFSVVSAFIKLAGGGPDETQVKLSAILDAIDKDYHELQNDLGAAQILQRNTILNGFLAPALARFQALPASFAAQPPLSSGDRINQIQDCITTLNSLSGAVQPDLVWNADFDWQTYWTDAGICMSGNWQEPNSDSGVANEFFVPPSPGTDVGYGLQAPVTNEDGATVFTYVYSLPAYLVAVACFLGVAGSLELQFPGDYSDIVAGCITTLQAKHDRIVQSGLISLIPSPNAATNNNSPDAFPFLPGVRLTASTRSVAEYGAVEKFSGHSDIEPNYPFGVLDDYKKIELRVLAKTKRVYAGVGLPSVWNTINKLKHLIGQEPSRRPNRRDWSFRNEVIPVTQIAPNGGFFHLKDIASYIRNTPPLDFQNSSPTSFRSLLTPTPLPPQS